MDKVKSAAEAAANKASAMIKNKAQWGDALTASGTWSKTSSFSYGDIAVATKWAAAATKFTCTKGDATAGTMTTDCNALLGVFTGGCCYQVDGTDPTKAYTSNNKGVAGIIGAVWPTAKGTKYLCATSDSLAKVPGFTAATNSTMGLYGTVDSQVKFAGSKTQKRTSLAGNTVSWTCSGASTLAATAATATALISLM